MQGSSASSQQSSPGSGGDLPFGEPHCKRRRREMANSNERKRMQQINQGYRLLQELVPDATEKMSKASLLQHTAEYIKSLHTTLENVRAENTRLQKTKAEGSPVMAKTDPSAADVPAAAQVDHTDAHSATPAPRPLSTATESGCAQCAHCGTQGNRPQGHQQPPPAPHHAMSSLPPRATLRSPSAPSPLEPTASNRQHALHQSVPSAVERPPFTVSGRRSSIVSDMTSPVAGNVAPPATAPHPLCPLHHGMKDTAPHRLSQKRPRENPHTETPQATTIPHLHESRGQSSMDYYMHPGVQYSQARRGSAPTLGFPSASPSPRYFADQGHPSDQAHEENRGAWASGPGPHAWHSHHYHASAECERTHSDPGLAERNGHAYICRSQGPPRENSPYMAGFSHSQHSAANSNYFGVPPANEHSARRFSHPQIFAHMGASSGPSPRESTTEHAQFSRSSFPHMNNSETESPPTETTPSVDAPTDSEAKSPAKAQTQTSPSDQARMRSGSADTDAHVPHITPLFQSYGTTPEFGPFPAAYGTKHHHYQSSWAEYRPILPKDTTQTPVFQAPSSGSLHALIEAVTVLEEKNGEKAGATECDHQSSEGPCSVCTLDGFRLPEPATTRSVVPTSVSLRSHS